MLCLHTASAHWWTSGLQSYRCCWGGLTLWGGWLLISENCFFLSFCKSLKCFFLTHTHTHPSLSARILLFILSVAVINFITVINLFQLPFDKYYRQTVTSCINGLRYAGFKIRDQTAALLNSNAHISSWGQSTNHPHVTAHLSVFYKCVTLGYNMKILLNESLVTQWHQKQTTYCLITW